MKPAATCDTPWTSASAVNLSRTARRGLMAKVEPQPHESHQ